MSEDDGAGLFDSDDEESEKKEEHSEDMKELIEKAKKKLDEKGKKAKSSVVFKINPEGLETDLDALADKIRELKYDGLTWGTMTDTEDIAFGLKSLILICTIIDIKVNMTGVEEDIEKVEGVSSVQIKDWQKL